MKKIFLLITLSIFINNYSLGNENCSSYKKLSKEYLKCLGGKVKKKTSGFGLDTNNVKEKK